MATHSSILAWRIPWTDALGKPGRLQSIGQEDPLEEGMATHFSILAWRIPWTEEPSRLQSIGLHSSVQFSSVTQSCPTLCDPMDSSPPDSFVQGYSPS